MSEAALIGRLLEVIENDIVPKTRTGVAAGNKVFGAAIVEKADLSLVIAETNNETENPLWHGEMHALKKLYERPHDALPAPRDCLFIATHEPCSLCLSAITWGGYDTFWYLFDYEDTRDAFAIPHDLNILSEVFGIAGGDYRADNAYWRARAIKPAVAALEPGEREPLERQVERLTATYAELSAVYQASKTGNDIPLA